jgi:hypothetical protein
LTDELNFIIIEGAKETATCDLEVWFLFLPDKKKGIPIKCDCGKTLGFYRNGEIYVKCRNCKRDQNITKHLNKN